MKILHVSSNRGWGGGENQVRLLMLELSRAGIDQLCIAPAGSPLATRLRELDLPVRPVPWRGGLDPRALLALLSNTRHFDIVHCHDAHALQLAILPAKLLRRRLVATRRVRFKTSALKWNRADVVIAVSDTVRERLVEAGVDAERIRVIHSGTDLAETRAVPAAQPSYRAQRGLPLNAFVAGTAAAFYPPKHITLIPETAALLPDVFWLIAGDGPERGAIERAIAEHNVKDRVHLLGWLPDARPLLRELDVYVSTSVDDGLGNSITESLALRVPVIAADAGGPAEIVKPVHDRTKCVLFEPRDAEQLAERIRQLQKPGVRDDVIAAQDERFAAFAIGQTAAQTVALYRTLMAAS